MRCATLCSIFEMTDAVHVVGGANQEWTRNGERDLGDADDGDDKE